MSSGDLREKIGRAQLRFLHVFNDRPPVFQGVISFESLVTAVWLLDFRSEAVMRGLHGEGEHYVKCMIISLGANNAQIREYETKLGV
jgi:hypothetical protein